jgi:hypothetical protein
MHPHVCCYNDSVGIIAFATVRYFGQLVVGTATLRGIRDRRRMAVVTDDPGEHDPEPPEDP